MREISIIMPLYNAARYLPEALHSILQQTYENFELICIDDCSTDGTEVILEEFQKKDDRIGILRNENRMGAAFSRNKGLKEAQGKYVMFLDGDDIFDEEMLEKAYSAMEKNDVDIAMFEYTLVPNNEICIKRIAERSGFFRENYCKSPFSVKSFAPRFFPNWSDVPYDKIFRRKFLKDNKLEFQDLPSYNDVFFSKMASYCAEKMIWLDDRRIMAYARDHSEPSRISNDRNPMCAYYAMEKLGEELTKRNMMNELAGNFYYQLTGSLIAVLNKEKNEERKRDFYNFLHYKGIAKCMRYGKGNYDQIDCYDQYLLESFQNNTYESGWFRAPDTYFQFYLKKRENVFYKYVYNQLHEKKKIVVWGIGMNGTSLLEYLTNHSLGIFAAVDSDKKKQGNIVSGYTVLKPDAVYKEADMIFTTSKQALWEIQWETKELEIEKINILEFLTDEET